MRTSTPLVVVVLIDALCFTLASAERVSELRGSGKDAPHFMSNTYGFLKSSGDRVGHAVQRILGVQSRLDDMVEDLSGEYGRWQLKQKELLTERSRINRETGLLQAQALKLTSLKATKDRVVGDLQVIGNQRRQSAALEALTRHQWLLEQAGLRHQIQSLMVSIEERQKFRRTSLEVLQNETHAIQQQQRDVQEEVANLNAQIAELQESRAKKRTAAAREHDSLLKEVASVQDEIKALQKELLSQAQLQVEHRRLAAQTAEVVQQREAYERRRVNCTQTLGQMDANIAAAKRSLEDANAAIISCQELDVVNQKLQGQLSECRAASSAGQR